MEPISLRLYNYFFKHKGFRNDTIIAKELGYSHPEKISRLFREGKSAKPSVDILEDITNRFGEELNMDWVLTGKGEMIKAQDSLVKDENKKHKKAGNHLPASVITVITREIHLMQASLEKLSKVVEVPAGPNTPMDHQAIQDLGLDKKVRTVKKKKGNRS